MKKFTRCLALCLIVSLLLCSLCCPAMALGVSKNYKTGKKNGAVLDSGTVFMNGRELSGKWKSDFMFGRIAVGTYKDIYRSESLALNAFVRYAPDSYWTVVKETKSYTLTKTVTTSASGSVNLSILKALKLSATTSLTKSSSTALSISPSGNKRKCRPCIRCDYVVIKYDHVIYNAKGKKIKTVPKTMKIPLNGRMQLVYKYSDD